MIRRRDPRQAPLIDPWGDLGPKRRQLLENSWAGLFRREILSELPVEQLALHFRADFGRPAKELHTVLGVLVLQQMHDLTDLETVNQLAFNAAMALRPGYPLGERRRQVYVSQDLVEHAQKGHGPGVGYGFVSAGHPQAGPGLCGGYHQAAPGFGAPQVQHAPAGPPGNLDQMYQPLPGQPQTATPRTLCRPGAGVGGPL